jgi:hypothetical protein
LRDCKDAKGEVVQMKIDCKAMIRNSLLASNSLQHENSLLPDHTRLFIPAIRWPGSEHHDVQHQAQHSF